MKVAGLFVVLLAGCATTPPAPVVIREPVEVRIPIIEACISEVPAPPDLISAADLAALADYPLVLALHRDRLQRIGYERVLIAALARCAILPTTTTVDR